jgi:hypothetical protein
MLQGNVTMKQSKQNHSLAERRTYKMTAKEHQDLSAWLRGLFYQNLVRSQSTCA